MKAIGYAPNRIAILVIFSCFIAFIIGFWYVMPYLPTRHSAEPIGSFGRIVVVIIIVVGFIYIMFDKIDLLFSSYAIEIGEIGMIDRTVPLGFISWGDVLNIREKSENLSPFFKSNIIELELKNDEFYFEQLGKNKSLHYRQRESQGKCPFYVYPKNVNDKTNSLYDNMIKALEDYRKFESNK